LTTAWSIKRSGAQILRGGAFKPRSIPYTFQRLGRRALRWLKKAGELTGLPIITELLDQDDLSLICEYSDLIQVGARNSQNYPLLKRLGKFRSPLSLSVAL